MTEATAAPVPADPGPYGRLLERVRQTALLEGTAAILQWDQETMMPEGGRSVEYRGRQLAQLAGLIHERAASRELGDLLAECEADERLTADPHAPPAVNLRELRRGYDLETRLPAALVRELAEVTSIAQHRWAQARQRSDFGHFAPWLERIVALNRQKADCWRTAEHAEPWDALAQGYEPGVTAAGVSAIFGPLRDRLAPLVAGLASSSQKPLDALHRLDLPIEAQRRFVRFVAQAIGFDFTRGRLDTSAHPFCGGPHRDDVRMTTRFREPSFVEALGSVLHEAGHGIYNQNVPIGEQGEHLGLPFGSPMWLAVHESQSRLWENFIGRSRAFWVWCTPRLREFFGHAVEGLTVDSVYRAMNRVEPGPNRVAADEATYNLHIMIRFEIERELVGGRLAVADLPAKWDALYRDYLGVTVKNDAEGCLQDVHWSHGAIGYFPTYTLGNLLAAQFCEAARAEIGDLDARVERGDFTAMREWLVDRIHRHGQRFFAGELCQRVTGKPLSADALLRHLESKLLPIYGM